MAQKIGFSFLLAMTLNTFVALEAVAGPLNPPCQPVGGQAPLMPKTISCAEIAAEIEKLQKVVSGNTGVVNQWIDQMIGTIMNFGNELADQEANKGPVAPGTSDKILSFANEMACIQTYNTDTSDLIQEKFDLINASLRFCTISAK